MAKRPILKLGPVYALAEMWVEQCLLADGSLFDRGEPVWTLANVEDLFARTHGNPQTAKDESFEYKLRQQLTGAAPEIYALAAEELAVYALVSYEGALSARRKREMVTEVLKWGGLDPSLPSAVEASFATGLVHPGIAYGTFKPMQLWFLLDVTRHLKRFNLEERRNVIEAPQAFRELVYSLPVNKAQTMREAILHLVHPAEFEAITAQEDKERLVQAFGGLAPDAGADLDARIREIRAALTAEHGDNFDFYGEDVRPLWKPKSTAGKGSQLWRVSAEAAGRSVQELFQRRIHEHFPAYLCLIRLANTTKADLLKPEFKEMFEEFFKVPGGPASHYLRPFSSRQKTPETLWLNPNIAGSLSASSLREGRAFSAVVDVSGTGTKTTYKLRENHADLARQHLADGQRIPVAELAAFLYRNEAFASKEEPRVALLVDVFRSEFGYDSRPGDFEKLYDLPGPDAMTRDWFEPV